jgi:hypothetical protein
VSRHPDFHVGYDRGYLAATDDLLRVIKEKHALRETLKAIQTANEQLRKLNGEATRQALRQEQRIEVLRKRIDMLEKDNHMVRTANAKCGEIIGDHVRENRRLREEKPALPAPARTTLEQAVRLVTEVLTGEPIQSGSRIHIAYEPQHDH